MTGAFYAGVSGLKLHELWLDIIGNNISNIDTPGYKKSKVSFEDLFSETIKSALPPRDGLGGVNASQRSFGSILANIKSVHTQGRLQTTDSLTDLAIEGKGFFILSDGVTQILRYTRAGTFDFDIEGNLVNISNGFKVLGWNPQRDPKTGRLILNSDNKTIIDITKPLEGLRINYDEIMPGRITKNIEFSGELNSKNPAPLAPVELSFTKEINSEVPVTTRDGIDINKNWKEAGFELIPNGSITINGATFRLDVFQTPKMLMSAINTTAGLGVTIEYDKTLDKFSIKPTEKEVDIELSESPDTKGHGFFTQIKIPTGKYNTGANLKIDFEHLLDPVDFDKKYFRWKAIDPKIQEIIETNTYYHVQGEKLTRPAAVEKKVIGTYQTSFTQYTLRIRNLPHPDVDPTTLKVYVGGHEVPQGRIGSLAIPDGFMFRDNAGDNGVDAIEFYGSWLGGMETINYVGLPIVVEYTRVGYQFKYSTVDASELEVKINGKKVQKALYTFNKNAGDDGKDLICFYSAGSLKDVVTDKLNLEKKFIEAGFNRNLPGTPLWNEITTLTGDNYIQVLWDGASWTSQALTSYGSVNSFISHFNTTLAGASVTLTYDAVADKFIIKTGSKSIRIRQNIQDGFLMIAGLPLPPNTAPTTYLNISSNTEIKTEGEVVRNKLEIDKPFPDAGFNNFSNSVYYYSHLVISWITKNGQPASWTSGPLNTYGSVQSFINAVNLAHATGGVALGEPAPVTIKYDSTNDRFVLLNTNPTTKISQPSLMIFRGILSILNLFEEDPGTTPKTLPTSLAKPGDVVTADYNYHKTQKAMGILQLNQEGKVINNFIDSERKIEVKSFDEVIKGGKYLNLAGDFSQLEKGKVDGKIIIKTLSGTYTSKELNTTNYPSIQDLIDEINRSAAEVNLQYNSTEDKFILTSRRADNDVITLYETGLSGFFSQIKLPVGIPIIGGNDNMVMEIEQEKPTQDKGWQESTGIGNTGKDYFTINLVENRIKDEHLGPPTYGTRHKESVTAAIELAGCSVTLNYADVAKETIKVLVYNGVNWIEIPYDETGINGWYFLDNAGEGGKDKIILTYLMGLGIANIQVEYTRLNAYEFKSSDIDPDSLIVRLNNIIQNPEQGAMRYESERATEPLPPAVPDYYFDDNGGRGGVDRIIFNKSFGEGEITVDYTRTKPAAVDIFIPSGNFGPEDIRFEVNTQEKTYTSGATPNLAYKDYSEDLNQTELKPEASYLYTTKEPLYDALGVGYEVEFKFERLGENKWLWRVQNPVKEDKLSAYGILQFKGYGVYDKDNSIIFPSPSDPATINKFKGIYFSPTQADGEVKVKLNFEKLIQYLDAKNTAKVTWQDGFATGKLIKDSIAIDSRGTIIGKFDNDKLLNLGQLALAVFANEQGLAQDSATTFTETVNSGKANIGKPGENNRGNIVSSQLEMSNVDLAEEFTNLIIAQRAFEANSRTILTVDHILRTLIEMKR